MREEEHSSAQHTEMGRGELSCLPSKFSEQDFPEKGILLRLSLHIRVIPSTFHIFGMLISAANSIPRKLKHKS